MYVRNTKTRGNKSEVRGRPGVFIGCPQIRMGYRVFDIKDKKIIVSRDVKFVESVFPFTCSAPCNNQVEDIEFLDKTFQENIAKSYANVIDDTFAFEYFDQTILDPNIRSEQNETVIPDNDSR